MQYQNTFPLGNQSTGANPTNVIDPVTGSIIADIGTSVIGNAIGNRGALKRQREAQDWNKRMWDEQNAYNHPAQVMARYQEAGLNPALMYKGTATPASPVAPAKAAPYSFNLPSPQILTKLNQAQSIKNSEMSRRMMLADIRLKHQKEMLTMIHRMQGITQHQKNQFDLNMAKEFEQKMRSMDLDFRQEQIEKLRLDKKLTDAHQKIRNKEWIDYRDIGLRPNDPYAFIIRNLVEQWNKAKESKDNNLMKKAEAAYNDFLKWMRGDNYEMSDAGHNFWYGPDAK